MAVPENTTFLCPHCNVVSRHTNAGTNSEYKQAILLKGTDEKDHKTEVVMRHFILKCDNCHKDSYFLVKEFARVLATGINPSVLAYSPAEAVHQYPIATPVVHTSVNNDVMRASIEAENCFSVRAFNACGVMARRAISCLCTDKGAKGKDLFEQLQYLKDNNLITPDLWEWAEELRIIGRHGAHPEWEEVSKEDAEYGLKFLQEIIRYVYINPAERAARRLKETKKKKL
ncbi:MAG: DUF4145 domain-containing protein [candidate division Zixibacteria bacterium]|nr:DUF4145 domain-containing protein [candidate division Zixibacteria bacterium]